MINIRQDLTGRLGVLEFADVPFEPKRIYWLSEVPVGGVRGAHAHKRLQQVFVSLAGSVEITIDDGTDVIVHELNREQSTLTVDAGVWRSLTHFSQDALIMVIASLPYDPADYIHDHEEFLLWKQSLSSI